MNIQYFINELKTNTGLVAILSALLSSLFSFIAMLWTQKINKNLELEKHMQQLILPTKINIAINVLKSLREIEGLIINGDIYKINSPIIDNLRLIKEPTYILKENEILMESFSESIELISYIRKFCVDFIAKSDKINKISTLNEIDKNELKEQMKKMIRSSSYDKIKD